MQRAQKSSWCKYLCCQSTEMDRNGLNLVDEILQSTPGRFTGKLLPSRVYRQASFHSPRSRGTPVALQKLVDAFWLLLKAYDHVMQNSAMLM